MLPNLKLQLKQTLKLTPQIQQSIHLLAANELEIEDLIEDYIASNPYLVYEKKYIPSVEDNSDNETYIFPSQDHSKTLHEYLHENLFDLALEKEDLLLANLLIEYIDSSGYLTEDYNFFINALKEEGFKIGHNHITCLIKKLQSISMPGLFASNLSECLLMQLEQFSNSKIINYAKTILKDHIDLLANKNYKEISKRINCSIIDIQNAHELIKKLNPRPGNKFKISNDNNFIYPELKVIKNHNNYEIIILNNFHTLSLQNNNVNKNAELFQSAKWLIKNLTFRNINLVRVARVIFEHHDCFINQNIYSSTKLTLNDIALKLELHESTVSRLVNNKYIETPQGIFELKSFLQNQLIDHSNNEIMNKIKNIIQLENKKTPLSDMKIYLTLIKDGITISRRTVTKYREKLGILAASKRKEL
ncbi:MAG: RNA polymerase factor sigma-54 [Nitrosomonadales bacterium]